MTSVAAHVAAAAAGGYSSGVRPAFIHTLWRSGGTYVWNKLIRPDTCAFAEPFHEYLFNMPGCMFEAIFEETREKLRHYDLKGEYFREYRFAETGGVADFRKSFTYDDYCLEPRSSRPELRAYIAALVEPAEKQRRRALLKFCRSTLRARWLHSVFDAECIYVLREPRSQWESCLSLKPFFTTVNLLIVGKNSTSPPLRPLWERLRVPRIESSDCLRELRAYEQVAGRYRLEDQYFAFYYLWLLALLEVAPVSDVLLDLALLQRDAAARKAQEERILNRLHLPVSLDDLRVPEYPSSSLHPAAMDAVEREVIELVRRHLSRYYAIRRQALERIDPWLAPEHRALMEALALESAAPPVAPEIAGTARRPIEIGGQSAAPAYSEVTPGAEVARDDGQVLCTYYGFYPPDPGGCWMSLRARLQMRAPSVPCRQVIEFDLMCQEARYYTAFPFAVNISAGKGRAETIAFAIGGETLRVAVALEPGEKDIELAADAFFVAGFLKGEGKGIPRTVFLSNLRRSPEAPRESAKVGARETAEGRIRVSRVLSEIAEGILGAGFSWDEAGWRWMGRRSRLVIPERLLHVPCQVCFRLACDHASRYPQFPFQVEIFADGRRAGVVHFRTDRQVAEVRIASDARSGALEIVLLGNSSFTPALLGLGPDDRDLCVRIGNLQLCPLRGQQA